MTQSRQAGKQASRQAGKQYTTVRRRYYGDNHILGAVPFTAAICMFLSLWLPPARRLVYLDTVLGLGDSGDQIFGLRTANLDPDTPSRELWVYNLPLWLWALCQLGVTLYVFCRFTTRVIFPRAKASCSQLPWL